MLMSDLFADERHHAGGKSKSRILPGVKGDAVFAGDREEYRPLLRRWVGDEFPDDFVLFIGMNPSVADASFNDPTIAREWSFCLEWGQRAMVKVNVSDYRMTDPKGFSKLTGPLQSAGNLETILDHAQRAKRVVMAHGKLPKRLLQMGADMTTLLREYDIHLGCFAKNADGSPKHSLYVAGGTPLQLY